MPSEEPPDDDQSPSGPPLPPEDRLWRHPSELGAFGVDDPAATRGGSTDGPTPAAGTSTDRPAGHRRGALAAVALASCLVGAVVALAGVALFGSDEDKDPADTTTFASGPTSVSVRTATTLGAAGGVARSVARIVVRDGSRWVTGAGTLVDEHGSVVTAASLVTGATQMRVTFEDGTARTATMVGTDPDTGLAVIHVDAPGVAPAQLADEPPTVGERVTLVTGPTDDASGARMLAGQVRTVDDAVQTTSGVHDGMLEIDREVLPDHDGCGVADADGRLVGVSLTGDPNDGRGGVVPADVVADVADDLVSSDAEPHAWLGIEAVDLTGPETTLLGVDGGARLTKVVEGSPAARAHLATGDVVISIDGRTARSTAGAGHDPRPARRQARRPVRHARHQADGLTAAGARTGG